MEKKVIYKDLQGYKVTSQDNYNARIQDCNKIQDCKDFTSANEIIEYYVKYCKCSENDFIVIE